MKIVKTFCKVCTSWNLKVSHVGALEKGLKIPLHNRQENQLI